MNKLTLIFASLALFGLQSASADDHRIDPDVFRGYMLDPYSIAVLDARTTEEYAEFHIAGAVNVPHNKLADYEYALPADKNQPIITYCVAGVRAGKLKEQLTQLGYTDVQVLYPDQMLWTDTSVAFNCGTQDQPQVCN